jgi:choline transport protein
MGSRHHLEGPYGLGKYGLALNIIGFLYLIFAVITFNFPTLNPVTAENMNYDSAAVGAIMLIALVTWLTTGRKRFTGPQTSEVTDGVIMESDGRVVPVAHKEE